MKSIFFFFSICFKDLFHSSNYLTLPAIRYITRNRLDRKQNTATIYGQELPRLHFTVTLEFRKRIRVPVSD